MRFPTIRSRVPGVAQGKSSRLASVAGAAGVVVVVALSVATATAAPSAQTARSGRIAILVTAHGSGKSYDIVTGAIADFGIDHDAGHNAQKVVLSKGTFVLAAGDFNKNFRTHTDKATCAVLGSSHANNLSVSNGTGAYAGITGSISITGKFVELARKSPNGKCEFDKRPLSASDVITGHGTVSY